MRFALFAAIAVALAGTSAQAATETVLHSFCRLQQCGDGDSPQASLVGDADGNLYGTSQGGARDGGIVFRLHPKAGGKWSYDVIYDFDNGYHPEGSPLILDTEGRLYGTASFGFTGGVVFRLTPHGRHWVFDSLHVFCATDCRDGATPVGGLSYAGLSTGAAYDGTAPLYGVAAEGGAFFGGVVFSLAPDNNDNWPLATLYAFCAHNHSKCLDGRQPSARPAIDVGGNLYGTASFGGPRGNGLIYKLSPGTGRRWTLTNLFDLCSGAGCTAGFNSLSGLVMDAEGFLYGTTLDGGAGGPSCSNGCGVLFKLSTGGQLTSLHDFCSETLCADGAAPANIGGLLIDASGNLFGTAIGGGAGQNSGGVVFEYSGGTYAKVYDFCVDGNCTDGKGPRGGLIQDSSGAFFGTTMLGGNRRANKGTVFEVEP
ncbi:MAG TPA: choice-of-anchor tandem repeat GloVer-containing protein [Rhizomicrobium sp.]|nr:choice-of-anchor tandem repeat GloVer-containing protein [Rhizomicrobium sp.]